MATHSSVLAWRIPGTAESVSHRLVHNWSDLAAAVNVASLTRLISFCSLSLSPFFSSNSTYPSKSGLHLKLFSSSVQSLSCVQLFVTPWTAARQASLFLNSWSLLKLVPIESVMPSSHLILCHSLLLLPSIFSSTSGSFPMSQFFTSAGQSIGVSALASVLPMNIQDWFP